jgi:thiamine-phosphate pyrophosphorylase
MGEGSGWPRLLVVTHRRRLVEQAGAAPEEWPLLLEAQIAGALAGGADLIQVREPDLDARTLVQTLRSLFAAVPGSATRVLVNDRVDVATITGAAGVHLTERSVSVGDARALQPPAARWVIGRSVHDTAGAGTHHAADYLLAGTVQHSASKPEGWRGLGWDGLAAIVKAAAGRPVVAIGGLGPEHAGEILRVGAVGLAGIGCFLPIRGENVELSVREQVQRLRIAFDRA